MMHTMKAAPYFKLSALIFLAIAATHAYRAVNDLPASMGDFDVPMWLSWVVVVVGLYLAWSGYKNSER